MFNLNQCTQSFIHLWESSEEAIYTGYLHFSTLGNNRTWYECLDQREGERERELSRTSSHLMLDQQIYVVLQ